MSEILDSRWQLLVKGERVPGHTTFTIEKPSEDEPSSGVRCPHCSWRPSAWSRWSCFWHEGSPEPFFEACDTSWNTFSTRGLCPGCGHQWQWTSCLRCGQWSLHEDWYEEESGK